jgi:hypothetical protein
MSRHSDSSFKFFLALPQATPALVILARPCHSRGLPKNLRAVISKKLFTTFSFQPLLTSSPQGTPPQQGGVISTVAEKSLKM